MLNLDVDEMLAAAVESVMKRRITFVNSRKPACSSARCPKPGSARATCEKMMKQFDRLAERRHLVTVIANELVSRTRWKSAALVRKDEIEQIAEDELPYSRAFADDYLTRH